MLNVYLYILLKDTYMKNTPSNKVETLRKSKNMEIWEIDTSNELYIRLSYTQNKFLKK